MKGIACFRLNSDLAQPAIEQIRAVQRAPGEWDVRFYAADEVSDSTLCQVEDAGGRVFQDARWNAPLRVLLLDYDAYLFGMSDVGFVRSDDLLVRHGDAWGCKAESKQEILDLLNATNEKDVDPSEADWVLRLHICLPR